MTMFMDGDTVHLFGIRYNTAVCGSGWLGEYGQSVL